MSMSYDALAKFYDELNAHVEYSKFADFYERIFKRFKIDPEIVLDLACGTGTLTEIMAARGYDMIGVDGSAMMLNIAQNKREKSGFEILYLNQEMSSFELYGTVGAIICSLDSVNHVTDKRELAECFYNCHMYLDYGGVFIFDINTVHRLKNVLNGTTAVFETDDVYCAVEHTYDARRRRFYYDMNIFSRTEDGTYERSGDFVEERPYEFEELSQLLYDAGFDKVYVYDNFKIKRPNDDCERAVFVAVKEK